MKKAIRLLGEILSFLKKKNISKDQKSESLKLTGLMEDILKEQKQNE